MSFLDKVETRAEFFSILREMAKDIEALKERLSSVEASVNPSDSPSNPG